MKRRRTHAESRRRGEGREDFSTRRREGAKKGSKKGFTPTGIAFGDPEDRRRRRDAEVLRYGADASGCKMLCFSSCRASPGEVSGDRKRDPAAHTFPSASLRAKPFSRPGSCARIKPGSVVPAFSLRYLAASGEGKEEGVHAETRRRGEGKKKGRYFGASRRRVLRAAGAKNLLFSAAPRLRVQKYSLLRLPQRGLGSSGDDMFFQIACESRTPPETHA